MTFEQFEISLLTYLASGQSLTTVEFLSPATMHLLKKMQNMGLVCDPNGPSFFEAMWSLVAKRMIYLQKTEPGSSNWQIYLTEKGRAAVQGGAITPDDPEGYMKRLLTESPRTSAKVQMYLREALKAYNEQCYLAATVMLGVAAEGCMLETAEEFVRAMGAKAAQLQSLLLKTRSSYVHKLEEFARNVDQVKTGLPEALRESLAPSFDSILDVIRITRNKVGHPSGQAISPEWCKGHLILYESAHRWLHSLKDYLAAQP